MVVQVRGNGDLRQAGGVGMEHIQEVEMTILGADTEPGHGRLPINICGNRGHMSEWTGCQR